EHVRARAVAGRLEHVGRRDLGGVVIFTARVVIGVPDRGTRDVHDLGGAGREAAGAGERAGGDPAGQRAARAGVVDRPADARTGRERVVDQHARRRALAVVARG